MFNLPQFLETIRNLDLPLRQTVILTLVVIMSIAVQPIFTKNKVDFFCNAVFFR